MPTSELILRTVPLSILVICGLYVAGSAWVDRRRRARGLPVPGVYPGSRRQVGDLNLAWWASLSTAEQAAHDAAVIDAAAAAEADAEEAARAVVERARVNSLFHP